ncbi:SAND domain-containing protein [Ditylenchus destructor]|uniref:SAND domain-containing protein n=1 Tax=Ditylenchus destructor TaxID=166010 RepID=A0AAD4N4G9_9BILA|nr:SAND domain-containing protein [Ditylenchus destructor]
MYLQKEESVEEGVSDVKSEITCKSEETDCGDDVVPEPSPEAEVHEIRCGSLSGKLHMQRFICPGIHRNCIEFEGRLITPRQFTIKAEKDKQKDWKGSIRLGRYNLRTLMELKTLDFFDHATTCSLKCQSRNYIKNRKGELDALSFLESISTPENAGDLRRSSTSTTDFDDVSLCDEIREVKRKASALDDYVTQTVPSINGSAALARIGLRAEDLKMATSPNVSRQTQLPQLNNDLLYNTDQRPLFTNLSPTNNTNGNPVNLPSVNSQNVPQLNGLIKNETSTSAADISNEALAMLLQSLIDQQNDTNNRSNFFSNLAALNNTTTFMANVPAHPTNVVTSNALSNEVKPMTIFQSEGGLNKEEKNSGSVGNIKRIMETNPTTFWSKMRELGVLEDLLQILSTTVEQLKHLYLVGGSSTEEFAAQKLSSLASVLDLGVVFGEKIHSRYVQTTLESNLINKELQELQRKADEHRRKLEHAKRKSQFFDQIIKSTDEPDLKKLHMNM